MKATRYGDSGISSLQKAEEPVRMKCQQSDCFPSCQGIAHCWTSPSQRPGQERKEVAFAGAEIPGGAGWQEESEGLH